MCTHVAVDIHMVCTLYASVYMSLDTYIYSILTFTWTCIHMYIQRYSYMYINICVFREMKVSLHTIGVKHIPMAIDTPAYIYIYMYIYIEREREIHRCIYVYVYICILFLDAMFACIDNIRATNVLCMNIRLYCEKLFPNSRQRSSRRE